MKKITLIILQLMLVIVVFSQQTNEDILLNSSEIPSINIQNNFPILFSITQKEKKTDKYISKILFGDFDGKNPIRLTNYIKKFIVIDNTFLNKRGSDFDHLLSWAVFLNLGIIHYMQDNPSSSVTTYEAQKFKFQFALNKCKEFAVNGSCKLLSVGLDYTNGQINGSHGEAAYLKQAANDIVNSEYYNQLVSYSKDKGCPVSFTVPNSLSNDVQQNSNNNLNENRTTSLPNNNQNNNSANVIKENKSDVDHVYTRIPNDIFDRTKFDKLLKDFVVTENFQTHVTTYKHLKMGDKVNEPTMWLVITKLPNGNCILNLNIKYFDANLVSTASGAIVHDGSINIISYSLNADNQVFIINNTDKILQNGTNGPQYRALLMGSQYNFLKVFLSSRDAKVYFNGSNKNDYYTVSKHQKYMMEETLELLDLMTK